MQKDELNNEKVDDRDNRFRFGSTPLPLRNIRVCMRDNVARVSHEEDIPRTMHVAKVDFSNEEE